VVILKPELPDFTQPDYDNQESGTTKARKAHKGKKND
jgi:hypothetical protein